MPTPVSPRAATVLLAVGVCVVVALLSMLVLPGSAAPMTSSCPRSGLPIATIDDRTYHCESVSLTASPLVCPLEVNQSWSGPSLALVFWNYTFHLARYSCGNLSGIAIEIKEPNGNVTYGATQYGEPGLAETFGMFTNDEEAGLMAYPVYQNQNATIYVETGA